MRTGSFHRTIVWLVLLALAAGLGMPAAARTDVGHLQGAQPQPPAAAPRQSGQVVFVTLAQGTLAQGTLPAGELWGGPQRLLQASLEMVLPALHRAEQSGALAGFRLMPEAGGVLLESPAPALLQELLSSPAVESYAALPGAAGLDEAVLPQELVRTSPSAEPVALAPMELDEETPSLEQRLSQAGPALLGELPRGRFSVTYGDYWVNGATIADSSEVTLRLYRGDEQIASLTTTGSPYFSGRLQDLQANYVGVQPGDRLVMQEPGQPDNTFILPTLTADFNTETDLLTGSGPANAALLAYLFTDDSSETQFPGQISAGGQFSINVGSQMDANHTSNGYLHMSDPATQNEAVLLVRAPYLRVFYSSSNAQVTGNTGRAGAWNQQVMISIYDDQHAFVRSFLVDANHLGRYGWVNFYPYDINYYVELTTPGGETLSNRIVHLTANPDAQTNQITGIALPSSAMWTQAVQNNQNYHLRFSSAADGTYMVDYTGTLDLKPGDHGWTSVYLRPGDYVQIPWSVPTYYVSTLQRYVWGQLPAYTQVSLVLKDSLGSIKASQRTYTYQWGYFSGHFYDENSNILPILPGDTVEITPFNGTTTALTVFELTANADKTADTISGKSRPGEPVYVTVRQPASPSFIRQSLTVTADSSGNYLADFAGLLDLRPGVDVEVLSAYPDGNWQAVDYYLPSYVTINTWQNVAYAYTMPFAPVVFTYKNAQGQVQGEYTCTGSYWGYCYAGSLGDLAAGGTLEVLSEGVLVSVPVPDLAIDSIDRAANSLSGRVPANASATIRLWRSTSGSNLTYEVSADAAGRFTLQPGAAWALQGGDEIELYYHNAQGMQSYLYTYAPQLSAQLTYQSASGYGAPNSTVVVHLKNSQGAIKSSGSATVSSWGTWYADLEAAIEPGDRLEMHNAGMVSSLVIPNLTLNANPQTDLVSGQAPAGSFLYLVITTFHDWYDTYLAVDSGGGYSFDPGEQLDLKGSSSVEAAWTSATGDQVQRRYVIPGVNADYEYDLAYGTAAPWATANLSVTAQGGQLKASQSLPAGPDGSFSSSGFCSGGSRVELAVGDTVALSGGPSVSLPAFWAVVNPETYLLEGGTLPNAPLMIVTKLDYDGWQYWSDAALTSAADGSFSLNLDPDWQSAQVLVEDPEGDRSSYSVFRYPAEGLSVAFTRQPGAARPNAPVFLEWEVTGTAPFSDTSFLWDTTSHACDRDYRFGGSSMGMQGSRFTGFFTAPPAGTVYVMPTAVLGGRTIYGPEIAIPVQETAPVITDPVNGTTNRSQPLFQGFAYPGAAVELFSDVGGGVWVASTTASASGTFSLSAANPLANGVHRFFVQSNGLRSNTVHLTVDSTLLVDPNRIFFYDRGVRSRIRDAQGYANLGGKVWFRPNDTVQIELPLRCSQVSEARVAVGSASYPLEPLGEVWTASFSLPNSNYAIIAAFNCGGTPHNILLTYGLIDPDGYVYDALEGFTLDGALVVLYQQTPGTQQFLAWDAATWGQQNPQWSDQDGYYSFIVPPGTYKLVVSSGGYLDYTSPLLTVTDAPVRHNVPLLRSFYARSLYMPLVGR